MKSLFLFVFFRMFIIQNEHQLYSSRTLPLEVFSFERAYNEDARKHTVTKPVVKSIPVKIFVGNGFNKRKMSEIFTYLG